MLYGVKVLYTYTVGERDERFYEISIFTVQAESFDESFEKVEKYLNEVHTDSYLNTNREAVKVSFEILDSFSICDDEDGITEVYSAHVRNTSTLPEEEYKKVLTSQCDADELVPLRAL
ncbi:MAG: DUF4288 domain-containing protein [Ruminococcaceae bacterium]|nr:DUF4288 domain-containing protein [Oscillospiraceae bacterium]